MNDMMSEILFYVVGAFAILLFLWAVKREFASAEKLKTKRIAKILKMRKKKDTNLK